jgi:hypothetical protein
MTIAGGKHMLPIFEKNDTMTITETKKPGNKCLKAGTHFSGAKSIGSEHMATVIL